MGVAEIRQVFKLSSGTVAGCYVTDGEIPRNSKIRVIREEEQVYEGSIQSLKRVKEEVKEVRSGYECGILLQDFRAIQEGDRIKAFKLVEVEPHL